LARVDHSRDIELLSSTDYMPPMVFASAFAVSNSGRLSS